MVIVVVIEPSSTSLHLSSFVAPMILDGFGEMWDRICGFPSKGSHLSITPVNNPTSSSFSFQHFVSFLQFRERKTKKKKNEEKKRMR